MDPGCCSSTPTTTRWVEFPRDGDVLHLTSICCYQCPLPDCRVMTLSTTRPSSPIHLQDAADVQRVRQGLQRALPPGLLQDRRLLYKADIYTHLGIYSRNEWQLKPTVHEARLA
jgi:hypothetical protein